MDWVWNMIHEKLLIEKLKTLVLFGVYWDRNEVSTNTGQSILNSLKRVQDIDHLLVKF